MPLFLKLLVSQDSYGLENQQPCQTTVLIKPMKNFLIPLEVAIALHGENSIKKIGK